MQLEKQQEMREITIITIEYSHYRLRILNRGYEFEVELLANQVLLNKIEHIATEKEMHRALKHIIEDYLMERFKSWYRIEKVVDTYVDNLHLTKAEYQERFNNLKQTRELRELEARAINEYEGI